MRGGFQSCRLADLDPSDVVEFRCRCGYEVAVRPIILRAPRGKRAIADDEKVANLAHRFRCRWCGYRGPENSVRVLSIGPARQR
jgi:hypothetical protein